MNDDAALLRRYADEGSESAFAEVVRRHVDLVYGAAMRRTGGDPHRAADVAQQVFTTLARQARKLSRHAVLGAWLHTATRNAALNLMISEQRRQAREHEAMRLDAITVGAAPDPDWDRLRPVLDAAIDELPEPDRAAVVLRFLECRAFAEIGSALHISADAARMRTERALEKLRVGLGRRGVTSTAAALGVLVAGQPLVSAPADFAATLSSTALATAGAGTVATAFAFSMSTKTIITALLGAFLAFGLGAYVGLKRNAAITPPLPLETPRQTQLIASLRRDNQTLKAEVERLKADVDQIDAVKAQLAVLRAAQTSATPAVSSHGPTLGLARWEVQQAALNNLRQIDAARKQHLLDKGHAAASITELVGRGGYIKAVRTVDGEDYSALSMNPDEVLAVTTPDGIKVTFDPAGTNTTVPDFPPEVVQAQQMGQRIQGSIDQAVSAYRAANNGKGPPNESALMPFFATPQEGADFVEFVKARKAAGL
jgi:RNA polymerase sigma factor (sigma-70 family)